ncbi:hypothetical protein [Streptomyces sp. NBC_00887]|uniref:hypothetical protein n=1 Tax=Streptomyces sp. NBC_00887 TaxID=2975859 RepID=UPI0038701F45|nr:hypothetical protein OG844_01455 [Streptomyces sp. NBC_00887]WSY36175.1 hypothetical protein OG844_44145 [Streptomyces sp. NBC_00887]
MASPYTSLWSLFRYARKYRRIFTSPMRGIRVGWRVPGAVAPMTDVEVTHTQVTAASPGTRFAVVLAGVHAARGETVRALQFDDLDVRQDRITIYGNVQPMGALTRAALRAWLTERRADPMGAHPAGTLWSPARPRTAPAQSAVTSS